MIRVGNKAWVNDTWYVCWMFWSGIYSNCLPRAGERKREGWRMGSVCGWVCEALSVFHCRMLPPLYLYGAVSPVDSRRFVDLMPALLCFVFAVVNKGFVRIRMEFESELAIYFNSPWFWPGRQAIQTTHLEHDLKSWIMGTPSRLSFATRYNPTALEE